MKPANAIRLAILTTAVALTGLAGDAQSSSAFVVSGTIRGTSGTHTIHVAVWDAGGFLTTFVVPFRLHRRPRFADVAMELDRDIHGADIVLAR